MNGVRAPTAAGRFYPADATDLAETVDRLLAAARAPSLEGELRALVVPHAGYAYSGAVAASAFVALPPRTSAVHVVLLGPSHFVPLRGLAVSGAGAWRTPLGPVALDPGLRRAAVVAGAVVDERPHRHDHALEVELPFLQRRIGGSLRVLPIAVAATADTAPAIAALAPQALIVVSSDLSHYLGDAAARRRDRRTAGAIVALDEETVGDRDACGAAAVRGLLVHAQRAQWACTLLDLRTSADATGDRERVVGYGAFAFTESTGPPRPDGRRR